MDGLHQSQLQTIVRMGLTWYWKRDVYGAVEGIQSLKAGGVYSALTLLLVSNEVEMDACVRNAVVLLMGQHKR